MEEYDVYRLYISLKSHFRTKTYNYFAQKGAVKASTRAYNDRNDKYFFYKLSNKPDVLGFLVANFVHNTEFWIGDFEQAEKIYLKWKGRMDGLKYYFREEISSLPPTPLIDMIKVEKGQVPELFVAYLNGKLSIETMTILIDCLSCTNYWNKELKDDIIWEHISLLTKKYRPFLSYNRLEYKQIIKEVYNQKKEDA